MGLLKMDDPNLPVPFCKDAALPLADAFQQAIGDLAVVFLEKVAAGEVTLATLDRLAPIKPSNINPGSPEQRELAAILCGRHASTRIAALSSVRARLRSAQPLARGCFRCRAIYHSPRCQYFFAKSTLEKKEILRGPRAPFSSKRGVRVA